MARRSSRAGGGGPGHELSSKHRGTLRAIFEKPTRANIPWQSIEALFKAMGATIGEREGSRVGIYLNDRVAIFHRPHPQKETKKHAVEDVRAFLTSAGIEP